VRRPFIGFALVSGVIDPVSGAVMRTLATVSARLPYFGPGSVALTPDGTIATVTWRTGEPGCFTHVGAVPTDGSGSLTVWGDGGTEPTVSPDGRRVAWLALSSPLCEKHELVVRTMATGAERRVTVVDNAKGFTGAYGPWWQADNAILLFNHSQAGPSPPALSVYNADAATTRPNTAPVSLGCLGGTEVVIGRPVADGTGMLTARGPGDGQPTRIELCRFDTAEPMPLITTPTWTVLAKLNRGGTKLLLIDSKRALSTATLDGVITPVSSGSFIDAAW
jgi:hypothetical protein